MKTSFENVLHTFDQYHDTAHGTNAYAQSCLYLAEKQHGGRWQYRSLTRNELLEIILPYHGQHKDESGGVELVPPQGSTLEVALQRLAELKNYQDTNPVCWATIKHSVASRSPVFISKLPIENNDYKMLQNISGEHFYHIDGLHRLIAWGSSDGYVGYDNKTNPVMAYIAG